MNANMDLTLIMVNNKVRMLRTCLRPCSADRVRKRYSGAASGYAKTM